MINSVVYLPKAEKEFDESIDFYESISVGLGVRFENQVKKKIKFISENPKRYRYKKESFRETMVDDFPFLVIYKYYEKRKIVTISSIFHTSRNPKNKYLQ
jgi:plasmid stabilization system protein ParE